MAMLINKTTAKAFQRIRSEGGLLILRCHGDTPSKRAIRALDPHGADGFLTFACSGYEPPRPIIYQPRDMS